jgi:hypothetical protein
MMKTHFGRLTLALATVTIPALSAIIPLNTTSGAAGSAMPIMAMAVPEPSRFVILLAGGVLVLFGISRGKRK